MDNKKIGAFIAELRKEKGLNQTELAERLSVTNKAVSKWECGDGYPEITLVPSIAKELRVTVDELLNGEKSTVTPNLKTTYGDALMTNSLTKFKKYYYISLGIAGFGLLDLVVSKAIEYNQSEIFFYIAILIFVVCLIISIIIHAVNYGEIKVSLIKYKDSCKQDEYYEMVKLVFKAHEVMVWTWVLSVALLSSQLVLFLIFKSMGIFIFNIIIAVLVLTIGIIASLIFNRKKIKILSFFGIDKNKLVDRYNKTLLLTINIIALTCGVGLSLCGLFIRFIYNIKIFRMLYNPVIMALGAIVCGASLVAALVQNIRRYKLK